ncbi:MAG TPA: hypothetical protein V6C72_15820 [Chroococcales cyanobacterium]
MTNARTQRAITVFSAALAVGLALTASTSASYAGRFAANHPRRAEVLRRDNRLNNRVNRNYGNLGGNYGKLERQDQKIRRQEQRDARMNGGHISRGEQKQLNREENHINKEIKHDKIR